MQLTQLGDVILDVTTAPYDAIAVKLWSSKKAKVQREIKTTIGLRCSEYVPNNVRVQNL